MSKFEPFVETEFGTLVIKPYGEEVIGLRDKGGPQVLLNFDEAESLRDILIEITISARPASTQETSSAPNTKGSFGAECNRASCKNVPATWKHRDLQNRYYCEPCGKLINQHNGEELCSPANR